MGDKEKRGSEKLLAAWKARALTEDSVREIAEALDKSPAKIEGAEVVGGGSPTGVRLSLRYDGDDGPWCGNDILFWFKWHFKHGGGVIPPRILIDGTPWPDLVRMDLTFGHGGLNVPVAGPGADLSGLVRLGPNRG
jgi:hypothetical protein